VAGKNYKKYVSMIFDDVEGEILSPKAKSHISNSGKGAVAHFDPLPVGCGRTDDILNPMDRIIMS
jgi:hypothetical protein